MLHNTEMLGWCALGMSYVVTVLTYITGCHNAWSSKGYNIWVTNVGCTIIPHHIHGCNSKCWCGINSPPVCSHVQNTVHCSAIPVHFQVQIVCNHSNKGSGSRDNGSRSSSEAQSSGTCNEMDNAGHCLVLLGKENLFTMSKHQRIHSLLVPSCL